MYPNMMHWGKWSLIYTIHYSDQRNQSYTLALQWAEVVGLMNSEKHSVLGNLSGADVRYEGRKHIMLHFYRAR